jgi:hypothetical protein
MDRSEERIYRSVIGENFLGAVEGRKDVQIQQKKGTKCLDTLED